jgi:hypothetical protein
VAAWASRLRLGHRALAAAECLMVNDARAGAVLTEIDDETQRVQRIVLVHSAFRTITYISQVEDYRVCIATVDDCDAVADDAAARLAIEPLHPLVAARIDGISELAVGCVDAQSG